MKTVEQLYEELRAAVDNGHESMTHEDALTCVRSMHDADRAMRAAQPENLHCKSTQKRLATQWGFVPAGAQQPGAWVPLPGTLPDPGKPVLLDIGKKSPIRAMWAAKHTLEVGMEDDAEFGEYDEATDTYYCPEGWYEWNEQEERHWFVDKTPVAWCELPTKTGTAQGQAPAQAAPAAVAWPSEAVAYLDVGAGGYLDLGTGLTDEALSRLPKGRHALVIAGTYGIDGYTAAPAAVAGPSEFPHEQMDAVAMARYKVVPSHESMFHRWAVVAGTGTQQLYIGREVECQNMARKFAGAFLDGAFAFHSMLAAAPTPPADSVLEDAARLDWLLLRISGAEFRRIGVHYSGNASRADVDAARKQGANHD